MTHSPPPLNSPDAKLNRARYYLRMAAQLCREASVPVVGTMIDEALRVLDLARLDEEELGQRPTVRRLVSSKPPEVSRGK